VGGVIWPLLRTRRWLGFTAVVVGAIVAVGLLSAWQWSRADDRRHERLALQAALAAEPAPVASIDLSAGPAALDVWRAVTARGVYLGDTQAVVRKRPLDARNGFWLMTPLQTDGGPVVWVNRGWLPAGVDALSTPPLPAPPPGEVVVTGYLRAFDEASPADNEGLPTGQVAAPAPELLPPASDALPAYIQLSGSDPEQEGLVALPLPEVDENRNISYAIQWLLFAAVAIGGWFFFLRREAKEDAAATQPAATQPAAAQTGARSDQA
jgi:cytochrome oxidase assembly protein ShyY1